MNQRLIHSFVAAALLPVLALGADTPPIDEPRAKRDVTYAVVGEDASSATYHFFYRLAGDDEITKVRLMWNGGAQNRPTVTDYYLDGDSIRVVERTAARAGLPALLLGRDVPFEGVRELQIRSSSEEQLIGAAGPGVLSKEERVAVSNLIHALSLVRKPLPAKRR